MIVKLIHERNGTALIEWIEDSQTHRAIVPADQVIDGYCAHPERGVPYGINFADYITIEVMPEDIDRELKRAGVWTVDDLHRQPQAVRAAINTAYGAVLQNLLHNTKALR